MSFRATYSLRNREIMITLISKKKVRIDLYFNNSHTDISLDIFEDDTGAFNHKFFISTKEKTYSDSASKPERNTGPFMLQTVQTNLPIFTSVKQHLIDLEDAGVIYENTKEYFFSNLDEVQGLYDFVFDIIVKNYKKSYDYSFLESIQNDKLSSYMEGILSFTEEEDRTWK